MSSKWSKSDNGMKRKCGFSAKKRNVEGWKLPNNNANKTKENAKMKRKNEKRWKLSSKLRSAGQRKCSREIKN